MRADAKRAGEFLPVLFYSKGSTMRVGYFQFDPVFGEVARNLDLVTVRLEQVEADLIVLPELFATGYQFVSQDEVARLAESVPDGATTKRLVDIARRRGW